MASSPTNGLVNWPGRPADRQVAVSLHPPPGFLASTMTGASPPTWRMLIDRAGVDRTSAIRVMQSCTGRSGADWVRDLDGQVGEEGLVCFGDRVARCRRGEPLQYVVGRWGFRSLELQVSPAALIPRPETEMVVEVALREIRGRPSPARAADLGTGTGAIAISLAVEAGAEVWATDLSERALALARHNVESFRTPAPVHLTSGSWYEALPDELCGHLDLVVSNPPYISEAEYQLLDPVVREYEPSVALVSGPSGLEAHETILASGPSWLAPGGCLVLEIAPHQAEQVADMACRSGFASVEVVPDLAGRDRSLVARR